MRKMKSLVALVLALVMVMALCGSALAAKLTPAGTEPGSITVKQSGTSVSVNGRTFRAYKILDVDSSYVVYSVPADMQAFYESADSVTGLTLAANLSGKTFGTAAYNYAVVSAIDALKNNKPAFEAFAKKALEWCESNADYYEATGTSAETVVFEHVPYGYYLLKDQTTYENQDGTTNTISAIIVDTTDPSPEIVVKATTITDDKSITGVDTNEDGTFETPTGMLYKEDPAGSGKYKISDVSFGDVLKYQIDTIVPDVTGYTNYKFVITDTLAKGLKLDKDSIRIKIGNDDAMSAGDTTFSVTTNPDTVTGAGETSLKIVLKGALAKFQAKNPGTAIAITYNVELTPDALVGAKNENEVVIAYSNNPDNVGEGDDFGENEKHGILPEKKTETWTTQLSIYKVDENNQPLKGAEFTLTGTTAHIVVVTEQKFVAAGVGETATYYDLTDGTYTTDAPDGTNNSSYNHPNGPTHVLKAVTHQVNENADTNVTATTGPDGIVRFTGLAAGTYNISESGVPQGYNGVDPFTVTITFGENTGDDKATNPFKFSASGTGVGSSVTNDTAANTFKITVQNNKGTTLPSTGGMGTTIIYVVGAVLVLGAAAVILARRKAEQE